MISKEQQSEIHYELRKTVKRRAKDYAVITIATFLYAVAISLFLDPNRLAPGGVTGISIILSRFVPLETGTLVLLFNIPILMVGAWKFGWRFILSTIYATSLVSIFINLLAPFGAVTSDPVLASIAGGSLMAVGLGLVFKAGATTGGTDILVKLLRIRFPYLKTGALFLITDALVVVASAFVFKDVDIAMYAGLVVVINSFLMDIVLYGRDGAKLIFIISDNYEAITKRLLEELDIGVTHISGVGAYSGKDKHVIMCVVKKTVSPKVEEIVREEDPACFMIVSSATEIFGEGYKNIFNSRL